MMDYSSSIVIKPPNPLPNGHCDLFLAGSIEMGAAIDWQEAICDILADLSIVIANPRRDDWDNTWIQSINSKPFREQVEWELSALEAAKFIALYLVPGTKSPISLLELGLFAHSKKLMVCCPPGFWRRGNVEIVTWRYQIPFFEDLKHFMSAVRAKFQTHPLSVERRLP